MTKRKRKQVDSSAPRRGPVGGRSGAVDAGPEISLGVATAIYLGLSIIYFIPTFLPGNGLFGTDYLAGGFFFHEFISQRFAEGELPKWVPYVYGGLPLFSNPGSAFHPVHMLADLIFPIERVLQTVFTVHFWLAGVGMFLFARALACRAWIAFLAGLGWQFTGLTLSWVYAGHDGRVMVATLAPMFFFFLFRGVRSLAPGYFAGAAVTLGLAMLSFQIQVAYYLILSAAIWGAFLLILHGYHRQAPALAKAVGLGVSAVAVAFLLAAINFLPFYDYVGESPRADDDGRGYEFSVSFSMPPSDVLGFAVPEQQGASVIDPETGAAQFPRYQGPNPMKLHTEYVGALVLLLLLTGVFLVRRDPFWWFFAFLALFALSLAFGGHTPLYRLYYEVLPGIKRFRAPDLALYIAIFSFGVMAALTLEKMAALRDAAVSGVKAEAERAAHLLARFQWVLLGMVGITLLGLLVASGDQAMAGEPSRAGGWARFLLFLVLLGGVLWGWVNRKLATTVAVALLAVISLADSWIVGKRFLHTTVPPAAQFVADDVVRFLQQQEEPFRVWNLPMAPYRRHDNYLMYFRIEQAGGEHGNQIHRWNEYAGAGQHVYVDWHNFVERPMLLAAANIRYLLATAELETPWLREVHRGSALVYENLLALPRAYLVPEAIPVGEGAALARMLEGDWDPRQVAYVETSAEAIPTGLGEVEPGSVEVIVNEPDRVVLQVDARMPSWLVLADNYYAGWNATIDGEPVAVVRTNHTFRGIAAPEGRYTVEFTFRPPLLYAGLWISGGTGLLLLGLGVLVFLVRRRRAAAQ